MPSTTKDRSTSKFGRRIKWLGISTALIFVLYSAGWHYVAQEGKRRIDETLMKLTGSGAPASCERSEIKGYPFRIGLFCDAISFEQPQNGIIFSAHALRSAAQVYNPKQAIIELDGPAQLEVPNIQPLVLNWTLLHASLHVAEPVPQRVSIESKSLKIAVRGPAGADTEMITADYASVHMRTEENDAAFAGEGAAVIINPAATPGRTIPEFATSYDAVLNDGIAVLAAKPKSLRGLSGTIRQSQIIFKGGGALKLTGSLKVDAQGLLDADLSIAFNNPAKLGIALSKATPEAADAITSALTTAALSGDNSKETKIEIKIRKGKVSTGFFPIGKIPPLQ